MLKPIDLTVLAFIRSELRDAQWTQVQVASGLGVSQSSVHRALQQLDASGLLGRHDRAFRGVLVHAVRHIYPPVLGAPMQGVAAAAAHPTLATYLRGADPLVWPLAGGEAHATSLEPLHPCVPAAALRNGRFYELMSLIDVLRVGRLQERTVATWRLDAMLGLS